jgi:hypothetical protein
MMGAVSPDKRTPQQIATDSSIDSKARLPSEGGLCRFWPSHRTSLPTIF